MGYAESAGIGRADMVDIGTEGNTVDEGTVDEIDEVDADDDGKNDDGNDWNGGRRIGGNDDGNDWNSGRRIAEDGMEEDNRGNGGRCEKDDGEVELCLVVWARTRACFIISHWQADNFISFNEHNINCVSLDKCTVWSSVSSKIDPGRANNTL